MDCTIITPVGKGHEQIVLTAIGSVMQAAEQDMGPFTNVHIAAGLDEGKGRSATRNALVEGPLPRMLMRSTGDDPYDAFKSEWLFFLDADDFMCNEKLWGQSPFMTVEPYVKDYDCVWGPIIEMNEKGELAERYQSGQIETYAEFLFYPPYQSVQIGHFCRRDAFLGFNEEMEYCEDVEYYLRVWKEKRCIKQAVPLFINRRGKHSWTKGKGPTGADWSERAEQLMYAARTHEGNAGFSKTVPMAEIVRAREGAEDERLVHAGNAERQEGDVEKDK